MSCNLCSGLADFSVTVEIVQGCKVVRGILGKKAVVIVSYMLMV